MSEIKKIRTMSWSLEYKLLYMGVGMEMEILTCNSVCVGLSQHVYKPSEKKGAIFSFGKGVHSSSAVLCLRVISLLKKH